MNARYLRAANALFAKPHDGVLKVAIMPRTR